VKERVKHIGNLKQPMTQQSTLKQNKIIQLIGIVHQIHSWTFMELYLHCDPTIKSVHEAKIY
jgi:hypothetical protein